jgi:hypothetical protein
VVDAYDELLAELGSEPDVGEGRMFRSTGLAYKRKFFVALRPDGDLLLKLPAERVDELVGEDIGTRFDRGDGRPLREWLTVPPTHAARWRSLATEALAFAHHLHG